MRISSGKEVIEMRNNYKFSKTLNERFVNLPGWGDFVEVAFCIVFFNWFHVENTDLIRLLEIILFAAELILMGSSGIDVQLWNFLGCSE